MNDLISKLSSYHLFNYLVPGVVFGILARQMFPFSLGSHDVIASAFLAYFAGLVVSRFGSLVIEPILERFKFMDFWKYEEYFRYSKTDEHLLVLYEVSNMYRTFASLFALLLILKLYAIAEARWAHLKNWDATILIILLLIVFLFSYKKQTGYITKRIDAGKADQRGAHASTV